jgi:thioesterase domain-containing protein
MIHCRAPKTKQEFEQYYFLRWKILREPWQQPLGSEQDELEMLAIHRAIFNDKGEILAVARLHCSEQFKGQIRYMAVAEHTRDQGLGLKLLTELERVAQQLGLKKITLQAREQALPFYQKLSYELLAASHLLYGEIQHYAMEKTLTVSTGHNQSLAKHLQQTWHQTIPMSQAMNVHVCFYDQQRLITSCDTRFNKNLHNTMFAGSIYTLATLTGWGWVYLFLQEKQIKGDIVLADANIRYHAPVEEVAHAEIQSSFSSESGQLL